MRQPRIACAVQARTKSTRLPDKVLRPLAGEPMVFRIVERLRYVHDLDEIVLATTDDPSDDALCALAERRGIPVYRGPVGTLPDGRNDIAGRLVGAAESVDADILVRVWGDCPCVDPVHVSAALAQFIEGRLDHINTFDSADRHTLPYGTGFEVYRLAALRAAADSRDPLDRLYPFAHVRRMAHSWRSAVYGPEPDWPAGLSLAVDYPEDLVRTDLIYQRLWSSDRAFTLDDVLALPKWILEMGQDHDRNTEYRAALP